MTQNEYWSLPEDKILAVDLDATLLRSVQPTKSESVAVLLCTEGSARVTLDARVHVLTKDSLLVVLNSSMVDILSVDDKFSSIVIACSSATFESITRCIEPSFFKFMRMQPHVVLPTEEARLLTQLAMLIKRVVDEQVGNPFRDAMLRNYFQNLLFHFYVRTQQFFAVSRDSATNRKDQLFNDFISLVHQYCATQREAVFYAKKMNITPRYLSSIVLAASGETTKNIIDRHAIVEIKTLLRTCNLSMQQIAQKLNFGDSSFFCRYFKRHAGISPYRYRFCTE